jgi:hypothetical protein
LRPTPGTVNRLAESMRQVPAYEPRTVVCNCMTKMQHHATDHLFSPGSDARASVGNPVFYNPGTQALTYGYPNMSADTTHRLVHAKGMPAILRGAAMTRFHAGLGQDDGTYEDVGSTLIEPTYSDVGAGLLNPAGLISTPGISDLSTYEDVGSTLTPPPAAVTPTLVSEYQANPQSFLSQTPSLLQSISSGISKIFSPSPTPTATALTTQQAAALAAAQNPLNQPTGIPGMTVGELLLIAGVLVGGAVLVSKLR